MNNEWKELEDDRDPLMKLTFKVKRDYIQEGRTR